MSDLDELLSRLDAAAGQQRAGTTYQGRVVGREEEHLHLAVETGVIAIPLAEIEAVRPLIGARSTELVSIDVRDHSKIKQVRRVVTAPPEMDPQERAAFLGRRLGGFGGGIGGIGGAGNFSGDTYTVDDLTTSTITGGVPDACDDSIPTRPVDDYPPV
jgi:hypothetical protein